MLLQLLHPKVANRSCEVCQDYAFNEQTGEIERHKTSGEPIKRPSPKFVPCRLPGKGCPKGTAEAPIELTDANWQVWQHYKECKATNKFPNDGIVRAHAVMIAECERAAERVLLTRLICDVTAGTRN